MWFPCTFKSVEDIKLSELWLSNFDCWLQHCINMFDYCTEGLIPSNSPAWFYLYTSSETDWIGILKLLNLFSFVFFIQASVNDSLRRHMMVGDLSWCERVASGVVQNMLRSCETIYTQVQLLSLLCDNNFGLGFSIMGESCSLFTIIKHCV